MDVYADVPLVGHERLAGMNAHPNPDRPGLERPLRLDRSSDGFRGPRECNEERVALRVHFDTAVPRIRLADHPPVLGEETRVGWPVLLKKTRRPLDVGEEKRDRAGRQRRRAHG